VKPKGHHSRLHVQWMTDGAPHATASIVAKPAHVGDFDLRDTFELRCNLMEPKKKPWVGSEWQDRGNGR